MSFTPSGFNGNPNFRDAVIALLNKHIFNNCHKQLLDRYIQMEKNSNNKSYYVGATKSEFEKQYTNGSGAGALKLKNVFAGLWGCNNLGHDLPVWIDANGDELCKDVAEKAEDTNSRAFNLFNGLLSKLSKRRRKTVMIIGLDPMRKDQKSGLISLSSPWGLHSYKYRVKKLIWKLISIFNQKGYNVYVTDKNKLYATNQSVTGKITKAIMPSSVMLSCLCDEIELVQPDIIIFVGGGKAFRGSADFATIYSKLGPNQKDSIFQIPHPAAFGGWKSNDSYWYDPVSCTWQVI